MNVTELLIIQNHIKTLENLKKLFCFNFLALQLLHGSRISLRLYNPNIEAVPKVIEQPTIYITRSVQTKVIYKETVNIEDAEYLQEEQIIDQEVE